MPKTSSHAKQRSYRCSFPGCCSSFHNGTHLKTHIEIHNDNRQRFVCEYPECTASYFQKSSLVEHQKKHEIKHNQEHIKVFHCDHQNCTAAFSRSWLLSEHRRTHFPDRPFTCGAEDCSKTFKTANALSKHHQVHQTERPHLCPVEGCDASFKTTRGLKIHQSVHSTKRPFPCSFEDCGAAFKTQNELKMHARSHDEKRKLHRCSFCGERFVRPWVLQVHERTHTDERPWKCEKEGCGASFTQLPVLKNHIECMHSPEGQQRQRKSEQATADVLAKEGLCFKREHRTSHNCLAGTWSSTDFLLDVKGGVVDVENDEYQHDSYGVVCEVARMLKIVECRALGGLDLPQMFVRFNPDAFRVDGKIANGFPPKLRRKRLAEFLKTIDLTEAPPLQIVYMYYNGTTVNGHLEPEITLQADFDPALRTCTRLYSP